MSNSCPYEAVLFDLDGTLLDTALDLGLATNHVLAKYGCPTSIDDNTARAFASDGMRALMRAGVAPEEQYKYDFEGMREDFLAFYYSHINVRTRFFPKMAELIRVLKAERIPFGIVTSKPHALAVELLSKFPELADLKIIVGCDLIPQSKPDPEPILYACRELKVDPLKCVYVGDHQRDIEAGHNAHMPAILAAWGYIKDKSPEALKAFGADFIAEDALALANILGLRL